MARRADCRKCAYFVPLDRVPSDMVRELEEWVAEKRPGERLLGYCEAYRRPVTYYTGSCYRYKPRTGRVRSILEFMGR